MFDTLRLFAIAFTALALVPAGAHLLELPHKLNLPSDRYLIVQDLYRGWAFAGIVVAAALLSTGMLALRLRGRKGFIAAAIGFGCIVATQIVFWSATYPANAATHDWTTLPANWQALRLRWELSHAINALLTLAALIATTFAALRSERRRAGQRPPASP